MAISYVSSAGIQGAITAGTPFSAIATFNATLNGTTTMTVNSVSVGSVIVGQSISAFPYATITAQLTGTPGGAGTYTLSAATSGGTFTVNVVSYDIYNVPSWVRRITATYDSITSSVVQSAQLGTASGIVSSGYVSSAVQNNATGIAYVSANNSFYLLGLGNGSSRYSGTVVFTLVGSNVWVQQSMLADGYSLNSVASSAGRVALSGQLTTLRLSAGVPTNVTTFNNGTFNILYE